MICPRCRQQAEELREGRCPYCSYPVAAYQRQITLVQVILGAIFTLTLVYGVLVAVLELAVQYTPLASGISEHSLGGGLLVASLILVLLLWRLAGGVIESGGPAQMRRGLIMRAVAAEMPALCGLVVYLIAGSLMWFAILLGASWLLFLRLGMGLPQYLNTIQDALGRE